MEAAMETYRTRLKRRKTLLNSMVALLLCVFIFVVVMSMRQAEMMPDSRLAGFTAGYSTSIVLVLMIFLIRMVVRYQRALRSDEALRKQYIAENDERARMIREKIGGLGLDLSLGLMMLASVATAFWQLTVSATFIAAAFLAAMVKLALKIYYCKQY